MHILYGFDLFQILRFLLSNKLKTAGSYKPIYKFLTIQYTLKNESVHISKCI